MYGPYGSGERSIRSTHLGLCWIASVNDCVCAVEVVVRQRWRVQLERPWRSRALAQEACDVVRHGGPARAGSLLRELQTLTAGIRKRSTHLVGDRTNGSAPTRSGVY